MSRCHFVFQYSEPHLLILGFETMFLEVLSSFFVKWVDFQWEGFLFARMQALLLEAHTCVPASWAAGECSVGAKKVQRLCRCCTMNRVLQDQVAKLWNHGFWRSIPENVVTLYSSRGGSTEAGLMQTQHLCKKIDCVKYKVLRKTVGADQLCSCWFRWQKRHNH